jgi:predicted O-methyltransferase YrrM
MNMTTLTTAPHGRLRDSPLAISREAGALLYMLARGSQARTIVEFGTSFGIWTLRLAAALIRGSQP